MRRTLWSADEDAPASSDDPSVSSRKSKLGGRHVWPFSFKLPRGVSIVSHIDVDAARSSYRLPASLNDGISGVHVEYQLSVRVHRGRLRGGSKLVVPIEFTPLLRPTPPSIARQLAYQENVPLVGADGDPRGWKTLASVTVRGKMFKTIPVEAKCTLALARPLCYTRGSPVPLMITIESSSEQALDLLATTRAIQLKLVQRITFGSFDPNIAYKEQAAIDVRSRAIARAAWWPEQLGSQRGTRRTLAGELHIPEAVSPRCHILNFNLEYMVVLDPFQTVGFVAEQKGPLLTQSVEIATAFAEGPRPRAYMPPDYENEEVEEHRPVGIRIAGILISI